jgi:DNA-binding IclR family transcriptional regulator
MRLTDICDQLGIPKSKGHAILHTLKQFELVDKDPHAKTYSLGPALIFLSQRVLDNLYYPEVVSPYLQDLVRETGGTAAFGLISDLHVFVIAKSEGKQNIGFRVPLGHKFHLTLGAHGKAIAAFMSDGDRERLLARRRLYFYGDSSRMDLQRLSADLAECMTRGFAQDTGDVTPGVNVLSAPAFGIRERMVGCVILIGTFDVNKIQPYGRKVALASRQISRRLGAHVESIYPV